MQTLINKNPVAPLSGLWDEPAHPDDMAHFYKLAAGFSSALVDMPSEKLQEELGVWFRRFARFLKVDSITLGIYSEDRTHFDVFQNYNDPDALLPTPPQKLDLIPSIQAVRDRLDKGKVLVVNDIAQDLSNAEREMDNVRDGVKSFVSVPVSAHTMVFGFFSMATFQREMQWSEDLVAGIKLLGESIAGAFVQMRSQSALEDEIKHRERLELHYTTILQATNVGFWISDLNQNLLEVNDAACRILGYDRDELLALKACDIDAIHSAEEIKEKF